MTTLPAVILLIAMPALGQMRIQVGGTPAVGPGSVYPTLNVCNETEAPQRLEGWRFRTRDFSGYTTWMSGLTHTGTAPVDYTQKLPASEYSPLYASKCGPAPVDYSGTLAKDQDATHFDLQALVKTGSCTPRIPQPASTAMRCAQISGLTGAGYYGNACEESPVQAASRRQGGFLATFKGQTQIQAAIPTLPDVVSGTNVKWDPRSLRGPQYMMALAMVQEYLNVDMRFLAAVAGKEMFFGFVNPGNPAAGSLSEAFNGATPGTYSPWQIEATNFGRVIQSYPRFFPSHGPCLSRYPSATQAVAGCSTSFTALARFYVSTPGHSETYTGINSPQLANAAFITALQWYWVFDALAQSTDLHFVEPLLNATDPRTVIASMIAAWNLGAYTDFASPLKDPNLAQNPNASSSFPTGNNNYRPEVFKIMDRLASAAAKSTACGGGDTLYDAAIGFPDVQRFFFGGSVEPGTPQAQGDGGLLVHIALSESERRDLSDGLRCAFDALKGKAPSTLGRDSISYRYDWLTMLRIAKAHLPSFDRPVPIEHDFQYVTSNYSKGPKPVSGIAPDAAYPVLILVSPVQNQVIVPDGNLGLKAELEVQEGPGAAIAEWTLSRNWVSWQPAELRDSGHFTISVPCSTRGFPGRGQKASLWVRATDACGNSTVQELAFTRHSTASCGDPVAIRTGKSNSAQRAQASFRVAVRDGLLNVESSEPIRGIAIYDFHGRLKAQPALSRGRSLGYSLENLPRGVYTLLVESGSGAHRQTLPWTR